MKIKSIEHIHWLLKDQCNLDIEKIPKALIKRTIKSIKKHWCVGNNFWTNELQMFNAEISCLKKQSAIDEYTPYRLNKA